jgi:sigma-B regulation protein RsbU (phosphoserine phosphatase)
MSTNITDNWQEQLDYIVDMMREMSRQTDPQEMVRLYAERVQQLMPVDARVSLSRRDLEPPKYRITRATRWKEDINPWAQPRRLPLLEGGLLGELLYGDAPRVINDLTVDPSDPAAEYLEGYRSLFAMPMYDEGVALNMVVLLRKQPHAFTEDEIPRTVWMGNLFGRATQNLVLHDQVRRAFDALDHEMQVIAEIQHSLLPDALPKVPTIEFAAHYQTSQRTGGDYYDLFHLRDNCLGILIADVSGHGSPAAVLMAILHSLVHTNEEDWCCPSHLFNYLNKRSATRAKPPRSSRRSTVCTTRASAR